MSDVPFVFWVVLAFLGFVASRIWVGIRRGFELAEVAAPSREPLLARIYLARYLTGFPDRNQAQEPVYCAVSNTEFIFRQGAAGPGAPELARLPRNGISSVQADDKSIIRQRLTTVTRLAFLGHLALALPKKEKADSYWLDLEWRDPTNPVPRHAVFEFTGYQCDGYARLAANELLKYVLAPPSGPGPDEKTCPHCAETIKKAAKIYRFCGHAFSP